MRGFNGELVADAVLDLWQADGEGLYEAQRHTQGPWMRGGSITSQSDGSYAVRTGVLKPELNEQGPRHYQPGGYFPSFANYRLLKSTSM